MAIQQYIVCMVNQYEQMFCFKLQTIVTSIPEKNDHPNVYESEQLMLEAFNNILCWILSGVNNHWLEGGCVFQSCEN